MMTETKWTPGPWEADDEVVFSSWKSGNQKMIGRIFEDADAHLIAASPELYEAVAFFVRMSDHQGFSGTAVDKARAALAKARGET